MTYIGRIETNISQPVSPLVLSDHFLRLAEESDSAGFRAIAERLITLANQVLDPPSRLAR